MLNRIYTGNELANGIQFRVKDGITRLFQCSKQCKISIEVFAGNTPVAVQQVFFFAIISSAIQNMKVFTHKYFLSLLPKNSSAFPKMERHCIFACSAYGVQFIAPEIRKLLTHVLNRSPKTQNHVRQGPLRRLNRHFLVRENLYIYGWHLA